MFRQALIAASIAAAVTAAGPAPAQQQITPEDFQQMQQQALQRMQQQGIDPQQIGDQIRQQMQDGTFNPQQLMQQLQQQGIIDPNMMSRFQSGAQQAALNNLKTQFAATDEEWAVLAPLLQKLIEAKTVADTGMTAMGAGFGGFGGFGAVNPAQNDNPVSRALADLKAAVDSPQTPAEQLNLKLQVLRDARGKARINLQNIREQLRNLLTVRQEAILLNVGYLD